MNSSVFLLETPLSQDFISNVFEHIQDKTFHDGMVGNHVNMNQKIRQDLWIKEPAMVTYVDNYIYSTIYEDVKQKLGCDVKFREYWKIGQYHGDREGFYNTHSDTAGETKYRKVSLVCSLTDPNEYEGGVLTFDTLDIHIKLEKGQVVVFDSSLLHRVTPVTKGIRTVFIGFFFDDEGSLTKRNISKVDDFETYIKLYIPLLHDMTMQYEYILKPDKYVLKTDDVGTLNTLGDIDYSDRHSGHSWTDKDDFLFESHNADTLVVTFAGMGWKDSIPTFVFHNFLQCYTNVDKLFLRDISCRYYIAGLKNSTNTFEETIALYRRLINRQKYKKIVAFGCSAGGYAAILYGQILGFDKVIAFSPQTVLSSLKEDLMGDIYNAPKTCKWLRTHSDDGHFQQALNLNNFRPFAVPIDIHYSVHANKGADKKHALFLESGNCRLFEHEGNTHMVALKLRDEGKLKEIMENAIF